MHASMPGANNALSTTNAAELGQKKEKDTCHTPSPELRRSARTYMPWSMHQHVFGLLGRTHARHKLHQSAEPVNM